LSTAINVIGVLLVNSVVQDWVSNATFRQQATMLSALRGCDGKNKEDPSKKLTRELRKVILKPADPDWENDPNNNFMRGSITNEDVNRFLDDLDHYPVHWLTHFMHSVHLVSIHHPNSSERLRWYGLYYAICNRLHVGPEADENCLYRLRDGRRSENEEKGARARI